MTTPERLRRRQIIESWLIAALCALIVFSTLIVWADENKDDEALEGQADRNTALVECLTNYAAELTDALQDRDVVVKTARVAVQEVWDTFRRLISDETPPPNARQTMIDAIVRYQRILTRLQRTDAINPYPDIAACLRTEAVVSAFRLVSYGHGPTCFGRTPTVRGTGKDDVIHGTDGPDVIRAFGGADIIHGGKGKDYICGGRGGDTINGGRGRDEVRGNGGDDLCVQSEHVRSC